MKHTDKIYNISLMAVVAIVIYVFSVSVIWMIDNYVYQFNFATGERITSVWEIFGSQYAHLFERNGRYVAHWLCQLYLAILGKPLFALTNALVYIAFIYYVTKLGKGDTSKFTDLLTSTLFVLFFCDTVYEPSCQIGYIWMPLLSLIYLDLFFKQKNTSSPLSIILLFVFSIIAGNSHEVVNIGIGGALIIYMLQHIKRLTIRQWVLAVGYGIGGLVLVLAPGGINKAGGLDIPAIYSLMIVAQGLRMTYVLIIVLVYKLVTKSIDLKQVYRDNSFLINAMIVMVIFNVIIGVYIGRQMWGIELFSTILTLRLLKSHSLGRVPLALASVAILALYVFKFTEIKKSEKVYTSLEKAILASADDTIYVDLPPFSKYVDPAPKMRYGNRLEAVLEDIDCQHNGTLAATREIKSYPAAFREMHRVPGKNQSYEFNPHEFILLQDKNAPAEFTLHRKFSLLGVSFALPDYSVPFDEDSYLNTREYNVLFLPAIFPFIVNTGVDISELPSDAHN